MRHTTTDSTDRSAESQSETGRYVVLSLADQKLTLEHADTLQPFEKRMFDQEFGFESILTIVKSWSPQATRSLAGHGQERCVWSFRG
jgi:hypothetical protein